ncbi:AraC family transcriptional regulator [Paenibacillus sp. y28]|uniref:AraC family transcriptional regulator n=1 Tax=Paenibacillus sp. y28 TaxID=3129110 RepID=UPI003016E130
MSILQFTAPPLPHYITCGFFFMQPGQKHLNRRNIGVFDLLVVTSGCLYMMEDDRKYEVAAGQALILRPDQHHYSYESCRTETGCFWLHFQTGGKWGTTQNAAAVPQTDPNGINAFTVQTFTILLPQFIQLSQPALVYEKLNQLVALEQNAHNNWARWKHQLIFQQILELLNASLDLHTVLPAVNVADQAAAYLRMHYKEDITVKTLGEALNFHPVYIARCMQKELGCSPVEYLMRYRIEQAKLLLLQTDLPIALIGENVGFHLTSYFSSCFTKIEGLSPRAYRRRFQSML